MIHSWRVLLDTLFPPTVHGLVLRSATKEQFVSLCQPTTLEKNIYLAHYHQPLIQAAIAATKFEHNLEAPNLLKALVTKWLTDLPPMPTALVPIPLSTERERKRGYNQVTRVIGQISDLPYPVIIQPKLLSRTKHTTPQTSLGRTKRLENMSDVFAVNTKLLSELNNYKRIIICDDVTTTGATLSAARAALAPLLSTNIELITVAWAH